MPSKKHPTVWDASPHTLAKISILKSYLYAYFQILGRTSRAADILYIDGFAGPGEYTDGSSGSPVAALEAAIAAVRDAGYGWEARSIYLAFIEADRKRVEHLAEVLERFLVEPEVQSGAVRYQVFSGTFVNQLPEVEVWCSEPFRSREPLFAFIDPFGATGVPFSVVQQLLKSPCSEIFFNLDADGIARILKAQSIPANMAHLNAIFDAPNVRDSWRELLHHDRNQKELIVDILDLYKERLREAASAKYVFAFDMSVSLASFNYYLVFASKHPRGLEKMKEAMKRLNGQYRFVDTTARSGQIEMRFDDASLHARLFFDAFKGQNIKYEKLHDWALNESPFLNPKAMLVDLQNRGLIELVALGAAKIMKGKFPEEKIASIRFAPERNQPFPPKR